VLKTSFKGESNQEKLVFVYNADSGIRNAIIDSAHKILSPGTYDCKLCGITFGVFGERKIWKDFREKASSEMEFLHKDEFQKNYASKFVYAFEYPVILIASNENFEVFISKEELEGLEKPEELIQLVNKRIKL
tara:strand:- start:1228 stop:1626 length:399 start_codon:yes stop_codon:yes gene_type:complete